MATFKGLRLEEFSIVRGSDRQPANPGAIALAYKATEGKEQVEDVNINKSTQAPGEPAKKSLTQQIADALHTVLKGTNSRTVVSEYTSSSTSTETINTPDAPAAAEPAAATVVVVAESAPTAAAKSAPAAAAAPAASAQATAEPDGETITKAIAAGLEPLVKTITVFDSRLSAIEKTSVGSGAVRKSNLISATPNDPAARFTDFTKFLEAKTPGQKLSKATITSGGWSYGLSITEATAFLDFVIDESTLLKKIRTVRMPTAKYRIDKIGLGGSVLKKGTPGVDPGDTVSVNNPTQIELSGDEIIAIVSVGDDTLEDNIEGDAFVQHLLRMIGAAAANELEQAGIHGDTAVVDNTGIMDRWDGYYKLAKANGAHVTEGMTDTDRYWPGTAGAKATKLLKSLPTKYRNDQRQLAWIQHPDIYLDYNDELATKGYSEAWGALTGMSDLPLRGIQNIKVPLMKTNMSFTYSSTPYTDGTFLMLTDLRNLIFGIQRDIRIEAQRFARKRCTDYVLSFRGDIAIENGDAIALYDHAKVKA